MDEIGLPSRTIEPANQEDHHHQTRLVSHAREAKPRDKTTRLHTRQTHSNFRTFKFRVYLVLYTRLFMKLNSSKFYFTVHLLRRKFPGLR